MTPEYSFIVELLKIPNDLSNWQKNNKNKLKNLTFENRCGIIIPTPEQ